MFLIPVRYQDNTAYDLWVVLQDENIHRVMEYDPAEVPVARLPGSWEGLTLHTVYVTYATDEEVIEVNRMIAGGLIKDALRLLSRGYKFRPDQGDHDRGPEKVI